MKVLKKIWTILMPTIQGTPCKDKELAERATRPASLQIKELSEAIDLAEENDYRRSAYN